MKRKVASYLQNQTLKQRFSLWIGTVIFVLGISIMLSFYAIEKQNRLRETESQLQQIVALQSLYIESWAGERLYGMKSLAQSPDAKRENKTALYEHMRAIMSIQDKYSSVTFVDKEGYVASIDNPSITMYVGERPYFEAAKNNQDYISGVLISKVFGEKMITFSSPVTDFAGQFVGAVVGSVSLSVLDALMEKLNFGETGEVYVLDGNGQIVAASRTKSGDIGNAEMSTEIVRRAMAGSASFESYKGFHGKMVYGKYQWSADRRWIIVGEITQHEVFREMYQVLYTMMTIILICLACSFAAVVVLTSRIEKPIRYLLKGTKIIRNGSYNFQIEPEHITMAPVELKQLCSTYNLMSRKLESTITLLERSALLDQLTEIHNRRYIMVEGSKLLDAALAAGHTCSVIMMDIDHFKKINDTYGHLAGDRVLRHAAELLDRNAGKDALVARYGGEEFIIVALNNNARQSVALAERLRQCMMDHPYRDEELQVRLSASFGVAECSAEPEFGTTVLEDMISRADHALYQAKSNGRNRVEVNEAPPSKYGEADV